MDPNENLREQRRIVTEINRLADGDEGCFTIDEMAEKAQRLAELVEAMDQWISRGGFLPREWSRGR